MAKIPSTSKTLLEELGENAQSARWNEFIARYRPAMEAYLATRFPTLDADDLIQETLLALVKCLPNYHYAPNEKGHFHCFLCGILRHKAITELQKRTRTAEVSANARKAQIASGIAEPPKTAEDKENEELREWRHSAYEIALQQLLSDGSLQERTKQVFLRTAIKGERPETVSAAFGISRNAVDQIKNRMVRRLRGLAAALESTRP